MNTTEIKIIKSKTNEGDLSKQYFILAYKIDKEDLALIIRKVVLTKDYKGFKRLGYRKLRKYNNHYLMITMFSIKIDTLTELNNWINEMLDYKWIDLKLKP